VFSQIVRGSAGFDSLVWNRGSSISFAIFLPRPRPSPLFLLLDRGGGMTDQLILEKGKQQQDL
jgi:hypothetical protein